MTSSTATSPDGTSIAWTTQGSGDPVVLVHGITESSSTWGPIVEHLIDDHQVVTLDLRGHGESGSAGDYGLESMAGDVMTVIGAAGLVRPHIVGHSLGGVVVSAVGAVAPVRSVVDVDQPLRLGGFKDQLVAAESMLRNADAFPAAMTALFEEMSGTMLSASERTRISDLRRLDQDVVLGVWDLILTAPLGDLEAAVEQALAGYGNHDVSHLSIFGIDPGDGYESWLRGFMGGAEVELWADHGHYPHLVDPDRFVARLAEFWAAS